MATARFDLDPSRPYQLGDGFLAIWAPRGRGRHDIAEGLLAAVYVCPNLACHCSRAAVAALPVDDGLRSAKRDRRGIKLTWRPGRERPRAPFHQLELDFVTGEVRAAHGAAIDPAVAPFFEKLIPAWVLDDIHAEWAALRPPLPPWFEEALQHWEPGVMLSMLEADPGARPEVFLVDGKPFAVDFEFCVQPGCRCMGTRVILLEILPAPESTWNEIAAADVDDGMGLRNQEGTPAHRATLADVYLAWRERAVNPAARLAELRARASERGVVLHALWKERGMSRPVASPVRAELRAPRAANEGAALAVQGVRLVAPAGSGRQGRNDLCACGSGRKYKRCCGG